VRPGRSCAAPCLADDRRRYRGNSTPPHHRQGCPSRRHMGMGLPQISSISFMRPRSVTSCSSFIMRRSLSPILGFPPIGQVSYAPKCGHLLVVKTLNVFSGSSQNADSLAAMSSSVCVLTSNQLDLHALVSIAEWVIQIKHEL